MEDLLEVPLTEGVVRVKRRYLRDERADALGARQPLGLAAAPAACRSPFVSIKCTLGSL